MTRLERTGLTLHAGGIGVGLSVVASWALGGVVVGLRPVLSGLLMLAGLAALAVAVVHGGRET